MTLYRTNEYVEAKPPIVPFWRTLHDNLETCWWISPAIGFGVIFGPATLLLTLEAIFDPPQSPGYITQTCQVQIRDINNSGSKEVLLKCNNRSYLLKQNQQGDPVLKKFQLKGVQILEDKLTE